MFGSHICFSKAFEILRVTNNLPLAATYFSLTSMIIEGFFVWKTYLLFFISSFIPITFGIIPTCVSIHSANAYKLLSHTHKYFTLAAILVLSHL